MSVAKRVSEEVRKNNIYEKQILYFLLICGDFRFFFRYLKRFHKNILDIDLLLNRV
jgi:hypothetical protein